VQVEVAERGRQQAAWILTGALDWSRIILREDALAARRNANDKSDHLGEPWAVPLAEARLSTFLAADKENTEGAPDAFLSGSIVDAQARYNLSNLIAAQTIADRKAQFDVLQRLCTHLNLSPTVAQAILTGLQAARPVAASAPQAGGSAPVVTPAAADNAPLLPQRVDQLTWLGIDPKTVKALSPHVSLLRDQDGNPITSDVNANTAPKEVLAAVYDIDLASAERLVQTRQRSNFKDPEDVRKLLPQNRQGAKISIKTDFFFVTGRLRLGEQVLEQRSLVQRDSNNLAVTPLSREWVSSQDAD
jgi:general secretion pathway protein K